MSPLRLLRWLRDLLDRRRVERELDAELDFHLQTRADQLEAEGLARAEALRRAPEMVLKGDAAPIQLDQPVARTAQWQQAVVIRAAQRVAHPGARLMHTIRFDDAPVRLR